jgi:hypothetical protein
MNKFQRGFKKGVIFIGGISVGVGLVMVVQKVKNGKWIIQSKKNKK